MNENDIELIIEDPAPIEVEVDIDSDEDLVILAEIEESELEVELVANPERVEVINMIGNLDGGVANSVYGGIDPIDAGGA